MLNFFKKHSWIIHLGLVILTFITTLFAGMEWVTGKPGPYHWYDFSAAIPYSVSIIFILGVHEMGHYIASRIHKVEATLPYFIPVPPLTGFLNFGTMGAVIKTKSVIPNRKALFDIGIAGPLAGFIACIIVLIIGFTTLPGPSYILKIHPDYFSPGYGLGEVHLKLGDTLLFTLLQKTFTSPGQFVPPMIEMIHYPLLCVGWFGLFVTALNLMPVGQLDGGHILYSMFGEKKHFLFARFFWYLTMLLGLFGVLDLYLDLNTGFGWAGWLFWGFILRFVIKLKHPEVSSGESIGLFRTILGYISFIILILSFTPSPFILKILG